MKFQLKHNDLVIDVFNDQSFLLSSDSPTTYVKVYQDEQDADYVPSSKHAVIVHQNGKPISSAILLGHAGGTGIVGDDALILEDSLIVRCSNIVFSLSLPLLNLNWMVKADVATCFSIHEYQNTIVTHGELSVSRIDKNGKILWSYGTMDILVRLKAGSPFEMYDKFIELKDFSGSKYKIDYNGQTLEFFRSDYWDRPPDAVYVLRSKKPWWKFWQITIKKK